MASYNELNALIDAYINRNGVQAITGQILNGVLKAMVEQLGRGYTIMGAATPTTDPGTPDGPESWFASTPGTYTEMGGLTVANAELALLSYTPSDGWAKTTLTQGITEVQATIDANVGIPEVSADYVNGVLYFDFKNLKGTQGVPGQTGAAAGFGTPTATVDGNVGTPGVSVTASGPDTAKVFSFAFTNLKGDQGDQGIQGPEGPEGPTGPAGVTSVVATVDNTTGNPTCTVSLNAGVLTLAFTGLKGAQGDTGSSVAYPFTIVNNLTTDDATQALSAAMGVQLEGEITQLELKMDKLATHHTETITKTGSLAVASGGQTLYFYDLNFRPGRKYTITVESDTDNTGYIRIGGFDITNTQVLFHTGNISQNINANPYTLKYNPVENFGRFFVLIRTIAVAGTLTLTVVEEWDEVLKQNDLDILYEKPGKNLANPSGIIAPRILSVDNGYVYVTTQNAGGKYITGYIPIKNGQSLVCNQSSGSNSNNRVALFKEKGDIMAIYGTDVLVNTNVTRTITNNLGYDAYAVFLLSATAEDVQVENGTAPTAFEQYSPIEGYLPNTDVDLSTYGVIGINYPEEVEKVILSIANNHKNAHKLHFTHVSDNHGSNLGDADTFTDPSPASFLVDTGDLVTNEFSDSFDIPKGLILAMTKPGYVVLGNHDVNKSTCLQARFEKFIEPLNTHNGLTGNTKTYYSVDFATEQVKCIFLDMNDGYDDVTDLNMSYFIAGKMSGTQINWFASELQDALTKGYDVACFIHVSPDLVLLDTAIPHFNDGQVVAATGVQFICDIIDAFMNASTASFTADGVDYTFTFATQGHFAGWFCGHAHHDLYGWLENYPKQFSCSVTRPYRNNDVNDGTYRIPLLGVAWNYVTINAHTHTMAIYRMGNQDTIYGVKREAFYVKYN